MTDLGPAPRKDYKYYDLIMAAFVTVMLCSNLVSAPKRVSLGEVPGWGEVIFGAGVIFFPISYIFGDILTEVYGYARSRRVVWAGFAANVFGAVVCFVTVHLPADPKWALGVVAESQQAAFANLPNELRIDRQRIWEIVFGGTWRIVLGSLVAFLCGEFANSYVLAKMKVLTNGRHLWARTIASTIVGELIDSALYLHIAFAGVPGWPEERILRTMAGNYLAKVGNEVLMTPVTYWAVGFLKRAEHEDHYDRDTDFTPFSLRV